MTDNIEIFRDKLGKVKERFRANLVEKIARLRELDAALERTAHSERFNLDAARELRQIAHNLAGTPVGIADPQMNHRSSLLENLLNSVLNAPDIQRNEGYLAEIHELVASIERFANAPVAPDYEFSPPVRVRNSRGLFLVDDDREFAANLADQLDHFGYETTVFTNPEAMEAALATEGPRPAAILMDIVFCEDDQAGLRSATRVNNIPGEFIPLIFHSARDDLATRLAAIRANGRAYLTKPMYVTALVDRLDELLGVISDDPLRVMIVEDDEILASYYALILDQAGLSTQTLANPATIFDALINFRPDLIVMDQYLEEDYLGSDLAQAIGQHEQFFDIPVVFLSTETSIDVHFNVLAAGGDIFLTKPLRPDHLVTVVTTKAERSRKLHALAIRDSLTRLLNHAAAKDELTSLVAQALRLENKTISVALLDLDFFKSINDTHGHATGDRVLLALARILKQRLRKSDVIARYGGEEFLVILPFTRAAAAALVMDEIREHFASVELAGKGARRFRSSFSCGIAELEQVPDAPALLEAADRALYAAKAAGRNRVVIYSPRETAPADQTPAAPGSPDPGADATIHSKRLHDDAGSRGTVGNYDASAAQPMPPDRLKDEFISAVSHELRTPLTGIRGAVGLLLGGAAGELSERARELLRVAESQGERLSGLVHDLLDMEQIESGRMRYRFGSCDFAHLVREAVHAAGEAGAASGISVELTDAPEELVLPRIDPVRIRKLLENLLHNAVKFSPPGGTVTVQLTRGINRDGRCVRFAVTDQGPGIPVEFHERVFNKFFQADGSASRERGGIGLGLSMCRAIVRRHGGRIGFNSQANAPTTFYFELRDAEFQLPEL